MPFSLLGHLLQCLHCLFAWLLTSPFKRPSPQRLRILLPPGYLYTKPPFYCKYISTDLLQHTLALCGQHVNWPKYDKCGRAVHE
jgi:hypothetical protein